MLKCNYYNNYIAQAGLFIGRYRVQGSVFPSIILVAWKTQLVVSQEYFSRTASAKCQNLLTTLITSVSTILGVKNGKLNLVNQKQIETLLFFSQDEENSI